ncbi:MAG: autotransporter assembly complex protein TamA [Rhizobiaceae bacterium]|nr:autotransporter assembly complex protein TamA [Rhizobiaceae bacterium]
MFGRNWFGGADVAVVNDPVRYMAVISLAPGEADPDLVEKLSAASELVRLQTDPVEGDIGLVARADADFRRLVGTLYEEAHYDGTVTIRLDGQMLAEIAPDHAFQRDRPVTIQIEVAPGPGYTLGAVRLTDETGAVIPTPDVLLEPGQKAGSGRILDAEDRIIADMRADGFGLAAVGGRDIVADSQSRTLDVSLSFRRGPLTPFGETVVTGTRDVDAAFVARMAAIEPGAPFSPEDLRRAERQLRALDVFSSISVRAGQQIGEDGRLPVIVEAAERKHRYFGGGLTFASDDGAGIEAYWGHRNLFGHAEKLRIEGSVGRIGEAGTFEGLNFNARLLFEKPGILGPHSKFVASAQFRQTNSDAFRRLSGAAEAGIETELGDDRSLSVRAVLDYSRVETLTRSTEYLTASLPIEYAVDRRDDPLDPTAGWRGLMRVTPAHEFRSGTSFLKLESEVSAYRALDGDGRLVLAGRIAAGTLIGAGLAQVPLDQRFFAGGGGSVRGYGFQGIGPRDADNAPTGGLSFAEISAELRARLTDTVGVALFVDGGTVSAGRTPDLGALRFGAGAGLRYLTPFGPLRLDVAVPLDKKTNDPDFGVYAGIGQSF